MAQKLDPHVVSTLLAAVARYPQGATLDNILAAFPPGTLRRSANRWVRSQLAAGTLQANTTHKPHRYLVASTAPVAGGQDEADAAVRKPAAGPGADKPVRSPASRRPTAAEGRAGNDPHGTTAAGSNETITGGTPVPPANRSTGGTPVPRSGQSITGGTPLPRSDQSATGGTPVPRSSPVLRAKPVPPQPPAPEAAADKQSDAVLGSLVTAVAQRAAGNGAAAAAAENKAVEEVAKGIGPLFRRNAGFAVMAIAVLAAVLAYRWYLQQRPSPSPATVIAHGVEPSAPPPSSAYAPPPQPSAADLERVRQQNAPVFAQLLQHGTWFSGIVTDPTQPTARVLLEVTDCSATTHQIVMVLRNDRGVWTNTRPFTGEWTVSADGESCTAKVRTRSADRISTGGPVLNDPNAWYLTLQVRLDGTVTADPREWQLQRVEPQDLPRVKAEFGWADQSRAESPVPRAGTSVDLGLKSGAGGLPVMGSAAPTPGNITGGTPVPRSDQLITGGTPVPLSGPTITGGTPVPRSQNSTAQPKPSAQTAAFPMEPGAYVQTADEWLPLPRNDGRFLEKSVPDDLMEQFDAVYREAGWKVETGKHIIGDLVFDGHDTVPVVPAANVVIAYIGRLPAPSTESPVIEATPLRADEQSVRFTPVSLEGRNVTGFGVRRVPAAVEQPSATVTVLRVRGSLEPGPYAIACGGQFFEFAVK